jgi:hypothetical protein
VSKVTDQTHKFNLPLNVLTTNVVSTLKKIPQRYQHFITRVITIHVALLKFNKNPHNQTLLLTSAHQQSRDDFFIVTFDVYGV